MLKISKKALKRESIIQAAIEVFSRNKFQESSISEIAQKAKVAEGTIYQYFKNKEDLFFSIPIDKTKEFCDELDLHLFGLTGAFNKIGKFIWYYLFFFKTNPEYGKILLLEMRVNKNFVKTKTYNSIRKSTQRILDIIEEGQKEGSLREDVNKFILRELILGILEHRVTRWLLKGEKYDLVKDYAKISELVFHGLSIGREER